MIFIIAGVIGLGGCVFCPHWIKTAHSTKDRARGFFCFITSIFVVIMCSWGILYSYNLLWYGQHNENSHIEMNINSNKVDSTSFLYLISQFDSETSIDDVISVMGADYDVADDGYEMKYATSKYSLDGNSSTFISFKFNSRKTKILSIKWAYREPTRTQFSQTLEYLEENALGEASSITNNTADWRGVHLEDTEYYLLLIREF